MSIGVINRRRRKSRYGLLRAEPTTLALRSHAPPDRDMHVIYPQPVAGMTREVNREEWARVVGELLITEAGGNRTHLAEKIGVKYLTVKRWLDATNAVSEENVRQVARVFKISVVDLLIRVGYYPKGDLVVESPGAPSKGDETMEMIDAAPVTPSQKREMREHVLARRAEADAAIRAEIERWIALMQRPRRRSA